MARKYIKYQIVETGEIKKFYQDEKPETFELTMKYYGDKKLPFSPTFIPIIFLEFGEEDD